MEEKYTINLTDYLKNNSSVLCSMENGLEAAINSEIELKYLQYGKVKLVISKQIRSINPSFLEAFLFSIITLNENYFTFRNKILISQEGNYNLENDLEESHSRAISIIRTLKQHQYLCNT